MATELFADVILPLAVEGSFTYRVPEGIIPQVKVGVRVVVPLGNRKYYTAVVHQVHNDRPNYKSIKAIVSVVDSEAIVTPTQIRFWEWLAAYYLCSIGEVMKSAIPSALKSDGFNEEISGSYTARTEAFITLGDSIASEEELHKALDSLKRAKVQYNSLIKLSETLYPIDWQQKGSTLKSRFVQMGLGSYPILKNLEEKGYIRTVEQEVSRYKTTGISTKELPQLTENQQLAHTEIVSYFGQQKPALLYGVTGSGKTEIYIHLIREVLDKGHDALYLLPEIALTAQLIDRLRNYFGDSVVVYHSRFTDMMRAECYLRVLQSEREPLLILGVRSSLLLPHHNLGIIIVDEEHETSYKQYDPSPRYHARDSALMLAHLSGANTLLGSATPSVESYFNAVTGKYGLVTLSERYGGVSLPKVLVSDTMRAAKRGEKISHFNRLLLNEIDKTICEQKQAILFQNRRGFSPYIECGECFHTFSCPHCNVSLTYHKTTESMVCHYCGYTVSAPHVCPSCGSADLQPKGFGTEKVEEELQKIFPSARIARLDLDSTRSASGYARIISGFSAGKIDILVGTQMVTKGFDFEKVALVGILNADNMLNFPDFRASERSFQLMMQVAGRAGRRDTQGTVIIQTSQPDNPVIAQIVSGDYEAMFRSQIAERQRFLYPPFCRLVKFTLKHTRKEVLDQASKEFDREMRKIFGRRLLGPEVPAVDKIRNEFLCGFLLKIEKEKSFSEAKSLVSKVIKKLSKTPGYASLTIVADVDPQ